MTPFEELQEEHIQKMNEDWGVSLEQFRRYQEANLSISMFFVDSAFMYRYAWCVGVGTVTTSNCKFLSKVDTNPFLTVSLSSILHSDPCTLELCTLTPFPMVQICRQWYDDLAFSPTLIMGGILVVLLQVVFL